MNKSELRVKYTEKRESFSQDEINSSSEKIFSNFLAEFKPVEGQKIHCFLSINEKKEINTRPLIKYFLDYQIRVYVPKILEGKLISVEVTPKTAFIKGFYGILEPESNLDSEEKYFDFVIVPLLYCDDQGNRVGYGKGFYDAFFADINPGVLKIGAGLFAPNEKVDDVWEQDIPLNYLVTPTEILSFGG